MKYSSSRIQSFTYLLLPLIPFILWMMLWLGLQTESWRQIIAPTSFMHFVHGLRFLIIPLAFVAGLIFLGFKFVSHAKWKVGIFTPIAPMVIYAGVGLVAATLSPEWHTSLYWGLLYLSVPLFLFLLVWVENPLEQITRLVALNWILIFVILGILTILGIIYLDLGAAIVDPSSLWKCERLGSWFTLTSGFMRSTGVGRFAAVTAIISCSLLWRGPASWKIFTLVIFYISLVLLMTTGARTSIIGFFAAIPIVILLSGGKKTVGIGLIGLLIAIAIVWSTGIPERFFQSCILREYDPSGLYYLNMKSSEVSIEVTKSRGEDNSKINLNDLITTLQEVEPSQEVEPLQEVEPSKMDIDRGPTGDVASPIIQSDQLPLKKIEAPTIPQELITDQQQASRGPNEVESEEIRPQLGLASPIIQPNQSSPKKFKEPPILQELITDQQPPLDSNDVESGANELLHNEVFRESDQSRPINTPETKTSDKPRLIRSESEILDKDNQSHLGKTTDGIKNSEQIKIIQEDTLTLSPTISTLENFESRFNFLPSGFLQLSGRTYIWSNGWEFIKQSPVIGFGFYADRLVLGTHIHNAILHSLLQSGIVGMLFFLLGLILAWVRVIQSIFMINTFTSSERQLVVQSAGILIFLSVRSLLESTGAFFGIDWLLLAPVMLYVHVLLRQYSQDSQNAAR